MNYTNLLNMKKFVLKKFCSMVWLSFDEILNETVKSWNYFLRFLCQAEKGHEFFLKSGKIFLFFTIVKITNKYLDIFHVIEKEKRLIWSLILCENNVTTISFILYQPGTNSNATIIDFWFLNNIFLFKLTKKAS